MVFFSIVTDSGWCQQWAALGGRQSSSVGWRSVLNQASGIAYTSHDISFISFSTPLPLSIRGWAGGTKGTLIHPLCSLPTLSRSIVNSSQCGEGDFHTRTRRAISVDGWVVLEKNKVGWLLGCWLVGRIVARRRKSNFDYFGAGSRQLRKGLRRPRKRVIGDFQK